MIDMDYAKNQFEAYLSSYDRSDDKINLKAVHTYCVLEAADAICRGEQFSEEDHQLAMLIALLHDIGRFEQLKSFHSFDDRIFNHGDFGVKVLFEDGLIRQFIADDQYDTVIRKAIQYHSIYSLNNLKNDVKNNVKNTAKNNAMGHAEGLTERELLHCRIIRDADKLDNFRVKDTERIETLFDTPEDVVASEEITPRILETVRARRCVVAGDRVTHMDCWVSYLAFIFDLNFCSSFRWIKEQDYMNRNIDRMEYRNPGTKAAMEEIREICNGFVEAHAGMNREA